jgi:uncharacterized repeat protein (TIGR01451 family)/fimbrial isopeptide formation D2 family protein
MTDSVRGRIAVPAQDRRGLLASAWRRLARSLAGRLLACLLLFGTAGSALAGEVLCSTFGGVIDGSNPATYTAIEAASTLGIDQDCTIRNFTQSFPLHLTINFYTPNTNPKPVYLIIFDNVYYTGNMACASIDHKLWLTNNSVFDINNSCQDLVIPVEKIDKQSPAATATVGVPFTYTLTIPVMYDPVSGTLISANGSPNTLGNIHVTDDLTALATGAEMTVTGINAYWKDGSGSIPIVNNGDSKHLDFTLPQIDGSLPGDNNQIVVEITVVLDNVPGNSNGTVFTNTAKWEFSRSIDLNENGIIEPNEFFDPLPGEWGVAQPMTIAAPNLVVLKSSPTTAINLTDTATFTIDAQNTGGSAAWNVTIRDLLPSDMCATNPAASLNVRVIAADGVTVVRTLNAATDYTTLFPPATCDFSVTLTDAGGAIAPNQRLRISYSTQLDPGFTNDGATLTNVAGATRWWNGNSTQGSRQTYTRTLTDGTPAVLDFQDSQTVTAGLSGYYFEKTVANLATGEDPAATAASGDPLRYRLRVFNVDQNINDITITDTLDVANSFVGASLTNVVLPAGAAYTFNSSTGALTITGSGSPLNLPVGGEIEISYDITLQPGLANGSVVSNQASLAANGGFAALSDNPYVNGVADPTVAGDEDPTTVTIATPAALAKANPAQATFAIGEQFTYRITVPATPTPVALYDVRILDDLTASAADLNFVSASVVSGGSWTLSNVGTPTNVVLADLSTGIDIPANGQLVVDVTVELQNTATNQRGLTFDNSASYTYNRVNGNAGTQMSGAGASTGSRTVVEPLLTVSKAVRNVTPGKALTDPAAGGDILEYVVTVPNSGDATAYDVGIADTLPPELVRNTAFTPTATINAVAVPGFVATPTQTGSVLFWGAGNGDESLDIPVGQSLVLTYRVNVVSVSGTPISNSVLVDWTSLDGNSSSAQRSGAGCPVITAPDDYCAGPAVASINTVDTNALAKTVVSDTWSTAPSTATDAMLRVGDTVVYRLTLNLREGQTQNVVVRDTLPAGLAFDSMVVINGDTAAPFSAAAPFTHADIAAPAVVGNVVTWTIGNVSNSIDNNTANDSFVIEYRARVVTGTLAHTATTTLNNSAEFTYTGGTPKTGSVAIEVRQPVLVTLSKTNALGASYPNSAAPLNVNIASDVMSFRLQACNAAGAAAPAYSLRLVDTLASQLDETSLTVPVVTVNGAAQTAGTGYVYTPPAVRGGTMTFAFNTPVLPGQCAVVAYSVGFHTDVGPNQLWNNSVSAAEYWSLPGATGQQYAAVGPAQFWMTNISTDPLPLKTLVSPATEATIGQAVVYEITVPATNASRSNVVVTDTLPSALVYDSATATVNGAPVALTDNSVAPAQVSLTLAQIPAGQAAVITLNTHVANTATTNAGNTFANQASYTYTGYTGAARVSATTPPLTIVEPHVTVAKAVTPVTPPVAGDILHYTVDLAAGSGANFSVAHDLGLVDTLSLGLEYVAGSATVGGVAVAPVVSGDGVATPQTLTWNVLSMAEGATLAVEYDVRVLNGVTPAQVLSNSVTARWTSLAGASVNERNGSGTPAHNDYFATASTSLGAPDNTTFAKTRLRDTFNTGTNDLRVGDHVEFELRLGLQEGTHNNLVVSDTLPTGLVFESVVSASFFGTASAAGTPAPAIAGQTLTWNLGTRTNPADGDAANDFIVIEYRARVQNGDTLAQTPTTQTLANNAALNYTVGGVPVLPKTGSASVSVLQPNLAVSKSAAPAGGDSVVVAGETVSYTVDIANSGTAPAYDTVLTDTLPAGMRQGGVTGVTSISLVTAGTALPVLAPAYNAATGVATWNFANPAYAIPADDTLRVVYTVAVDADAGASLSLTNAAVASPYYSFAAGAVPANGVVGQREVYGPSNTATATVTTPAPGALQKATATTSIAVGGQFTYTITVPAVPVSTALYDVRIVDDLAASAADLRFVSVSKVTGSGAWVPVNTSGSTTQLVIEDTANGGIDIPAGEQISVDVTVEVLDTATNVSGLVFANTADYTYNRVNNTPATQGPGQPGTSGNTTITGADALTLEKSGPATMRYGQPGTFTLNVQNTGTATAWDITVTDLLPNPTPGGMCSTPPTNYPVLARVFAADGTTLLRTLVAGTDFDTLFTAGAPCTLTVTGLSANAALDPTQRLVVTYQAELDADTPSNTTLTNVAGTTEWFSQDTAGAGATGETRTYTRTLTDGTVGTSDHQDAHTITTEPPTMQVEKTVFNVTTGQSGATARPGDTLRYSLRVTNISPVTLPNFALRDDVGALNPGVVFVPGSLANLTAPAGADTSLSNPGGGSNGAGLVDVRNLTLGAQGSSTDTVLVEFEVRLAAVLNDGTVVYNQAALNAFGATVQVTDDPAVAGSDNPTETRIDSAPLWRVQKTSDDLTGNPDTLQPGDTLRYTITVKNIGNENASGVTLRDVLPAFTTYVAGSTRLNGTAVTDAAGGVSPLQAGMLIRAPGNPAGAMPADASASTANVATITFSVIVNSGTVSGTLITNQGFVNGSGAGGGAFPEKPSDDPGTTVIDDPTRDIVGPLPLLDAQKTVALVVDNGTLGTVEPGDVLRYTLTVSNANAIPATGVTLTDALPADTAYVADSTTLNGAALGQPDGGVLPLAAGVAINSPAAASGTVAGNASAVVTFDVTVNAVAAGTVISNQGTIDSVELPVEATDADGIDSNGDQPTTIVVGAAQQLAIVKEVSVVGGGAALPGSQLEYLVRVTNTGTVAATNVLISDDLSALGVNASYVAGSARLNGATAGVNYTAPLLTADYATAYGTLAPGATATLRFRVLIAAGTPTGTTLTNTGTVSWSSPPLTASSSVDISVGGLPGTVALNGQVWHDTNFSNGFDSGERRLAGWTVLLYRAGTLLGSTSTDANGNYRFTGLAPALVLADQYELRFRAPGAGARTAMLGVAASAFSNFPQRIGNIGAAGGSNLLNLDLPIDPNGVVYDAVLRTPVRGATLTLLNAASGTAVADSCFDDANQQRQVTSATGFYKFDLNFSDASCPAGGSYLIRVAAPGNSYAAGLSRIIPPQSSAGTAAYSVPACANDAIAASPECEAQASATAPGLAVPAGSAATNYYLHVMLDSASVPGDSQLFNNHIPLDPRLDNAVSIRKTSALVNASRGQLVPYVITVGNTLPVALTDMRIVDTFPPGFKYVAGSARVNGQAVEPVKGNRELSWSGLALPSNAQTTIKLLFIVGAGVGEGAYVNRAQVFSTVTGSATSGEATATVRVVPDPTFDCSDVIGKVFDDANFNGVQDAGEKGLPGVRLATARGLLVTTDNHGRYHLTCVAAPDENRGANFIVKVDDRTLPTGYRLTTENPVVQRLTRGKLAKFNFGATLHRVVRLDLASGVFVPGSSEMRPQWQTRFALLMGELKKGPATLRLAYMAETEDEALVQQRLQAVRRAVAKLWSQQGQPYELSMETEVFWRTGAPPARRIAK